MGREIVLGLNLALFYGLALIVLAIAMGIRYHFVCSKAEARLNTEVKK